jgi:hypothetical protein
MLLSNGEKNGRKFITIWMLSKAGTRNPTERTVAGHNMQLLCKCHLWFADPIFAALVSVPEALLVAILSLCQCLEARVGAGNHIHHCTPVRAHHDLLACSGSMTSM